MYERNIPTRSINRTTITLIIDMST
jgi:hypothetical protein